MTTSLTVASVALQIKQSLLPDNLSCKFMRDCKEVEYGVGWVWSRVWSVYRVWSSLKLRERSSMDMNQELTVAGIGCIYTNSSIYPLMLPLKKGWGSSAVCLHQGCPVSPPVAFCPGDWEHQSTPAGLCAAVSSQNSFQVLQWRSLTPVLQSRCAPCSGLVCLRSPVSVFSLFLLCPALGWEEGSWSAMEKCSCRPKNRFPGNDLRTNQTQGICSMLLPPV